MSTRAASLRTPSIVLDFDGTLTLGHGPVRAYARLVAPLALPGYLERVEQALAAFDVGAIVHRDGYDVVASLAAADGVDAHAMGTAYLDSRKQLGTDLAPVTTIDDLDGLLATVGAHARLLLATNAPQTGIDRVLEAWGVRDRFDEVHCTVGKPAGLSAIVERAIADGPVLAIGDIVELDLEPAQALGADTALVGATAATSPAPVTMRGATLAHIRTRVETWAATASASIPAPNIAASIHQPSTER